MNSHARKQQRPRKPSPGELAKVGIDIIDQNSFGLQCRECRSVWSPTMRPGGRLQNGYWKCPNRCNWGNAAGAA